MSKIVLMWFVALAAIALGVMFLASISVVPMYENYSECGTIFLCSENPRPASPEETKDG